MSRATAHHIASYDVEQGIAGRSVHNAEAHLIGQRDRF
jgi:hypothetical protein